MPPLPSSSSSSRPSKPYRYVEMLNISSPPPDLIANCSTSPNLMPRQIGSQMPLLTALSGALVRPVLNPPFVCTLRGIT